MQMSKERRKAFRFYISWLILLGVIGFWFFRNPQDMIWDVVVLAIVVAAGSSAFGEDRFAEALGTAREVFQSSEERSQTQSTDEEERSQTQSTDDEEPSQTQSTDDEEPSQTQSTNEAS